MALVKRGKNWYGDNQADIPAELLRYSRLNGYTAEHFSDALCVCDGRTFRLRLDDAEGVAIRVCVVCGNEHPIGDSARYLAEAEPEECECPCGGDSFEIIAGVALHENSGDVRWFYLGCRCPSCGLVACYGDWKNEYEDYRVLLRQV